MGDTKSGREEQAAHEARRQREREVREALERADEVEPVDDDADEPRVCHRRGCNELATFVVLERYLEETGHGPVESVAVLCEDHTAAERPTNLDHAYAEYVFRVDPYPGTFAAVDAE